MSPTNYKDGQHPEGRRVVRAPAPDDETTELAKQSPLPDFCSAETLLRVLMVAVLLALAVTLLRGGGQDWVPGLALHALFIFWVALTSLLILCAGKRLLVRLPLWGQIILPPLVPIANTAAVFFDPQDRRAVHLPPPGRGPDHGRDADGPQGHLRRDPPRRDGGHRHQQGPHPRRIR